MGKTEIVPVSEKGIALGEYNPRAQYTDEECELVFELRSQNLSYGQIAEKLEMSRTQVWRIVQGYCRNGIPARWVRRKIK